MGWGFRGLDSFETNVISFCLLAVLRRKGFDAVNVLCVWVCFEFGFEVHILVGEWACVLPVIDVYLHITWPTHALSGIGIVDSCHQLIELSKRSTFINIKNWPIKVAFDPSYLTIDRLLRFFMCKLWIFMTTQLYNCFCPEKLKLSFKLNSLRLPWIPFQVSLDGILPHICLPSNFDPG